MITCMHAIIIQSLNLMRKRLVRDTTFTSVFQTQLCSFNIIWATMQTSLPSNLKTGQRLIWNITPVYTAARTSTEQNKVPTWNMLKLVEWFGQKRSGGGCMKLCTHTSAAAMILLGSELRAISCLTRSSSWPGSFSLQEKTKQNVLFSHCIQWP